MHTMHTPSTFHTLPLVFPSVLYYFVEGAQPVEPANVLSSALEQFGANQLRTRHAGLPLFLRQVKRL